MKPNPKQHTEQPSIVGAKHASLPPAQVAATLRALADVVETEQAQAPKGPVYIVGLEKWAEYGFSSYESIKSAAANGLKVCKGPRGRLMATVEDIHAWIQSRPLKPKKARAAATDLDDWQAQADAELEALARGGAA